MTITLYHFGQSRSLRAAFVLEELNVPYTLKTIAREDVQSFSRTEDFLAISPMGKFPVMTDGDVTLIESIAIMEYLMNKYGGEALMRDVSSPEYPTYLQWLHFGEAGFGPYISMLIGHTFSLPEAQRIPGMAKWGKTETMHCVDAVSKGLGNNDYLCPSGFSAADISVFYMMLLLRLIKQFDDVPENIKDWYARVAERPAWQAALAKSKGA